MFESSLIESSAGSLGRTSIWTKGLSFVVETLLVGVAILVPLLYTEALPKHALSGMIEVPAPPPPAPVVAAPTELKPIERTHSLPPYPTISQRLGEQGTSQIQVSINTGGRVTDCKVIHSSGSKRLDNAACSYVQGHWRWEPPTRAGKKVDAKTNVSVVWNLKNAQ